MKQSDQDKYKEVTERYGDARTILTGTNPQGEAQLAIASFGNILLFPSAPSCIGGR